MRADGVRPARPGGFLTEMLSPVLDRGLQAEHDRRTSHDR
jgi:hypothetical protein